MFTFFSFHYFFLFLRDRVLRLWNGQRFPHLQRGSLSRDVSKGLQQRRDRHRRDALPLQSSGSCRGRAKPSLPSEQGRRGFVCVFMLVFLHDRGNLLKTLNGGRLRKSWEGKSLGRCYAVLIVCVCVYAYRALCVKRIRVPPQSGKILLVGIYIPGVTREVEGSARFLFVRVIEQ